jgi:hypothetical protein
MQYGHYLPEGYVIRDPLRIEGGLVSPAQDRRPTAPTTTQKLPTRIVLQPLRLREDAQRLADDYFDYSSRLEN